MVKAVGERHPCRNNGCLSALGGELGNFIAASFRRSDLLQQQLRFALASPRQQLPVFGEKQTNRLVVIRAAARHVLVNGTYDFTRPSPA